jgi:hypothetical protein
MNVPTTERIDEMDWVLLFAVIVLCVLVHFQKQEIDALKNVQIHMYKIVCKEDFEKAKQMYYEKYGDDAE